MCFCFFNSLSYCGQMQDLFYCETECVPITIFKVHQLLLGNKVHHD